jgi:copper chaperone CopZ
MLKVLQSPINVTVTAFALMAVSVSQAQEAPQVPPAYTVIAVEKMHCEGCAKRIGAKLQQVAGVASLQVDVQKKLLWVHPQPGRQLSPRALWEAVEQARDRPLWVQGPTGKFLRKPNS